MGRRVRSNSAGEHRRDGEEPEAQNRQCDRHFDERPRVSFPQHHRRKFGVQRVAAAMRHQVADQRMADERHVADHV